MSQDYRGRHDGYHLGKVVRLCVGGTVFLTSHLVTLYMCILCSKLLNFVKTELGEEGDCDKPS